MTPTQLDTGTTLISSTVAEVRERWLQQITGAAAVQLDVSPLNTVDTAGLQLIVALQRECGRSGIEFQRTGVSDALTLASTMLGIPGA